VLADVAGLDAVHRERELLQSRVLPRVRQMSRSARANWSTGRGDFGAWAMAATTAVDVELRVVRLQAAGLLARARLAAAVGQL
jgi:hypothetical protein